MSSQKPALAQYGWEAGEAGSFTLPYLMLETDQAHFAGAIVFC